LERVLTMNCREFTRVAAAWLDGELPEDERARAEEHAAECADCARLVEDLAAADGAIAAESAPERPEKEWEAFNRELMVRIAMEERSRVERSRERLRRMWRTALKATAAAAALFVAALAGYVFRGSGADAGPETYRTFPGDGPGLASREGLLVRPEAVRFVRDPVYELERLLTASERILIRLANADLTDEEELAAIRSVVIDAGIPVRLAEARRNVAGRGAALDAIRPVEIILVRVANGSPTEPGEFREIRNAILDSALVERTRALRHSM